MAQYKVPQDVEADDKLIGPFSFRQFIYLIIAAGMIALAWALFQVFPLLVIVPLPIVLFFGALALPLKKDQPMETYLAAIVSFYLKPHKRIWEPGQPESTIQITAPKQVEVSRTKDLTQDEASHRLSFLAEIVDSEGHAIKGPSFGPIKEEVYAEASSTQDMFEASNRQADQLDRIIQDEAAAHHTAVVEQMKTAIDNAHTLQTADAKLQKFSQPVTAPPPETSPVVVNPAIPPAPPSPEASSVVVKATAPAPPPQPSPKITELAHDKDLSVETIAKQANRIERESDDEVYISLH